MIHFLLFLSFSFNSFAGIVGPVSKSYQYQSSSEYQAILSHLKTFGEFSSKDIQDVPIPGPKAMSRGQQLVEEAKARNRAILAARTEQDKKSVTESSTPEMTDLKKWKAEEKRTLKEWKRDTKEQLNSWKREQEIFLGRIKVYKENTFVIPAKEEKIVEKKIPVEAIPDVHIINEAFKVPVKDQSSRPTCVAFAGIRAIEILLAQNQIDMDLSEQYLYWASKPKCQETPCTEKGSWITPAYSYSIQRPQIDIPLESNCSYKTESVPSNETQLPLPPTCQEGSAKVTNFQEIKTISEMIEMIKKDIPVIIAAKLSENFYKNKGLITLTDSKSDSSKLDSHALGHAFLGIGIMELPAKLKASEGQFCLVVVNSWGKGWGAGGYSCITQNWLEKFRRPSSFVAVTKLTVR